MSTSEKSASISENDKYPGDSAGGELLAFTIREWIIIQQQLQHCDALANVYCQNFRELRKTGNYREYWPQRGLAARKWHRKYFLEFTLDNTSWFNDHRIAWNVTIYSRVSLPTFQQWDNAILVEAHLTSDDMANFDLLVSYFDKFAEYRYS